MDCKIRQHRDNVAFNCLVRAVNPQYIQSQSRLPGKAVWLCYGPSWTLSTGPNNVVYPQQSLAAVDQNHLTTIAYCFNLNKIMRKPTG